MEEILSSIRRIITDDDKIEAGAENAAPAAAQTPQAQQDEELGGEADSQTIDDIARVLSSGTAEVDEEEEILDLASELGGLELVEVIEEAAPAEELELVEEVEPLEVEAPAPEFVAEAEAPIEVAPLSPSAEELAEEASLAMEMYPQVEVPQVPATEAPVAEAPPSASHAAASDLERAIAALKAGQVPTSSSPEAEPFQFQATPEPASMPGLEPMPEATASPEFTPDPIPMAIPMEAPEPEAETHPEPEPLFGAQAELEPVVEAELEANFDVQPDIAPTIEVVAEPELESIMVEVEETIITEELVSFEAPEVETEKSPFWPSAVAASEEEAESEPEAAPAFVPEPDVEPEPVPVAAFVNGALGSENAAKTLEDSVKDMLRPMLRQWLDDNMPRMVKDQLGDDVTPGQQD